MGPKFRFIFMVISVTIGLSSTKIAIDSESLRSILEEWLETREMDQPTGDSCWSSCEDGGICPSEKQSDQADGNVASGKSVCASSANKDYNLITDESNSKTMVWTKVEESGPWFVIDLEEETRIKSVKLTKFNLNPESGNSGKVVIRIGNEKDAGKNEACGCESEGISVKKRRNIDVECGGLKGRYLFVVGEAGSKMGLYQVGAFAFDDSAAEPQGNIAWNQLVCMSSTKKDAKNAVDGDEDSLATSEEEKDSDPWLRVALGSSQKIGEVKIVLKKGRQSKAQVSPLEIRVGDSNNWQDGKRCGCGRMSMESNELLLNCGGISGENVFLVLPRQDQSSRTIAIAELQVYEYEGEEFAESPEISGYDLSYGCNILRYNDAAYEDVSEVECAEKCKNFLYYGRNDGQGCLSFEFDRKKKNCYLSTRTAITVPYENLMHRNNYVYYENNDAADMCFLANVGTACTTSQKDTCKERGCCEIKKECYKSSLDVSETAPAKACGSKEECSESWFNAFESSGLSDLADLYFKDASTELDKFVVYTSSEFVEFVRNNEVFKTGLLSSSWPLNSQIIENMYEFYKRFGSSKMEEFPQLFLGIAYARRDIGVKTTPLFLIRHGPNELDFSKDQLEQFTSLTEDQIKLVLAEEEEGMKYYEEQEEKANQGNIKDTATYVKASEVENEWDRIHENELLQEQWADLKNDLTELCGVEKASDLPFPPRGEGTNGLEAVDYYLEQPDTVLYRFPTKTAPWPLLVGLHLVIPVEECYWSTEWSLNHEKNRISTYTTYGGHFQHQQVCRESTYGVGSLPWLKETTGMCGVQSAYGRFNYICHGIPSGRVVQPGHAAGFRMDYNDGEYGIKTFQSLTGLTQSKLINAWPFPAEGKENSNHYVENQRGLALSMNLGLEQWQEAEVAFRAFQFLPEELRKTKRARKLLYSILQANPYMVHVYFYLSGEITYAPGEEQYAQGIHRNLKLKYPSICPDESEDADIEAMHSIARKWVSNLDQPMPNSFVDYWLRMYGNPKCCQNPDKKEKILTRLETEISWLRELNGYDKKPCDVEDTMNLQVIKLACEVESDIGNPEMFKSALLPVENLFKQNEKCNKNNNNKRVSYHGADWVKLYFLLLKESSLLDEEMLTISQHACSTIPPINVQATAWAVTEAKTECVDQMKELPACDEDCQNQLDAEVTAISDDLDGRGPDLAYWQEKYSQGKCVGICGEISSGEKIWHEDSQKFLGKNDKTWDEEVDPQQDFIDSF